MITRQISYKNRELRANWRRSAHSKYRLPKWLVTLAIYLSAELVAGASIDAADFNKQACHATVIGRCVNLVGKWQSKKLHGEIADTLVIKATESNAQFLFELDVTRAEWPKPKEYSGMGKAFLTGRFDLKQANGGAVALYVGPSSTDPKSTCAIIFRPISVKKISITSFGVCEEAAFTSPDGIYSKD